MLLFPNCKINIGLNIISKREDGFHDLETIFYPVKNQFDALEVTQNFSIDNGLSNQDILFSQTGLNIAGDSANNLCVKAYHLLKTDFPNLPSVQMHLHKT